MEEKIKELIDDLRPLINQDGGDIEFVRYEDKYVFVKFKGACVNCLGADNTMFGLEAYLKNEIPEIEGVINVLL